MASFSSNAIPPPQPPAASQLDAGFTLQSVVSPTLLLVLIILAIIFFFSGLLHLLLRFFFNPRIGTEHEDSAVDGGPSAFQGQLRHLFHLHDAGVDQTFIDALPVFFYKALIGPKSDPFDCSVCLSEFQPDDKLRLLTQCSHAFHMDCIDTWLLTHSTCPLCRASLLSDFGFSSPIVGVLESAGNSSREIGEIQTGSFLGFLRDGPDVDDPTVVPIKLGKFKSLERNAEGSSNIGGVDSRRCFSMGSFGYVMDENLSLKVPIRTPAARKKRNLQMTAGIRAVMSECGCESRREFNLGESNRGDESFRDESRSEVAGTGEPVTELERRAFSFHFPANGNRPRSEKGMDEENQRRKSFEIVDQNGASFVRRALQRLMGRNTNSNRIVHSSFTPNNHNSDS